MADLKVIIIGVFVFVSLFGLIILSSNMHTHMIVSENTIIESLQEFLDTVTDRGAITWNDYDNLVTSLASTGGTFDVFVTVHRMFAIPDTSPLSPNFNPTPPAGQMVGGFTRDYRPIHGVSTRDGSWNLLIERLYLHPGHPQWIEATHLPLFNISPTHPELHIVGTGSIFMRRHDLVTLHVQQTSYMQHQLNMLRQLNLTPGLREWSHARGSRNAGNQMVDDSRPPICFDGLPC